ncbi:MAG TPA: hypothetical protein VGQ33_00520 [Vicinamibacteria bacterium]|nr:hypothetical protein [Vicinamibacteria bacterium]
MSGEPLDARGCLTAVGFARIAAAPTGRAPTELAAHLASCGRCQRRLLASASSLPAGASAGRRTPPPVWRAPLVVIGVLLILLAAMAMLRHLTVSR